MSYTLYGWKLSYFTGKLFSYLRYKNIPFVENNVNVFTLYRKVKANTGAVVMPTMKDPNGMWLQDTRHIINTLEGRFPTVPSVFPTTAKRMFISSLFEAWGDEWWIPIAMHYRWSYPESVALFMKEAGDSLVPYTPRFVKNRFAEKTAATLINYLPYVGVVPDQFSIMESWTMDTLSLLDAHFKENKYLLGNSRPTIGDFGLMGPLYAHLSRDPWPRDHLMNNFPRVNRWIERMIESHESIAVSFDEERDELQDVIPATLEPIIRQVLSEFGPMISQALNQLNETLIDWPKGKLLKRTLYRDRPVMFPMGGASFRRTVNPHWLFKAQG